MAMFDFICMGSAKLGGTGNKRKIQNKIMPQPGIQPALLLCQPGALDNFAAGTDVLLFLQKNQHSTQQCIKLIILGKRDNPSKSATNQRLKLKRCVAFAHIISRNIVIRTVA